ncbi:MAG: hybrid sensor histidine kinase/response regulator [Magnetococcales bacterium]|nr:hybrid sensor histidine kinase/response regulator [Magnetococcales bacterium]
MARQKPATQKTVLIVDDQPQSLDILKEILSPFYRIQLATNGRIAIKAAHSTPPPDLILLDIMMPETDGYETCRILKQDKNTRDIPILFVTAKSELEDETKGFEYGAVDYLVKPVSPAIVLARVRTHLSLYSHTKKLEVANERLKELDRLKSLFIASMSHELRTPLNAIIGFIGVMLQGMSGPLNDRQKDHLGRAYGSAKHLLALIVDVIDISKIEAGYLETHPEEILLEEVVQEALDTIAGEAKKKGLEVMANYPETLTLVTDRKRLLQCLLNYLSNAVKYTPQGRIMLNISQAGRFLEVAVTDTGVGISEKELPRLFDSFVRLEATRRLNAPGTGLGLYLTRKIVTDLLGGKVSATSREGYGSTFMLTIPMDARQIAPPSSQGATP